MIVMKFGGSSVGDGARMAEVARLALAEPGPVAVVVSAMGGATDALLAAGRAAEAGDLDGALRDADALASRHRDAAPAGWDASALDPLFRELRELLQGVALLREQTPRSRALLASIGERASHELVAAWINASEGRGVAVDAREVVLTNAQHEAAEVDVVASRTRARARLLPLLASGAVPVITGFLGATSAGVTTLLGRGGSDWSGALFGAFLDADAIWIWTDVDGILTADPRVVRDARSLTEVSYREAAEMSFFGAKVLHPKTMLPARRQGIPIVIRSTFAPDRPGTRVSEATSDMPYGVKTVTAVRRQTMITVQGPGMAGVPGIARRIFEVSERAEVNVVMISQASSEQTVTVIVARDDGARLVDALHGAFALELGAGLLAPCAVDPEMAVVSVIGAGMAGHPGVSSRLFTALATTSVNVAAIAQGGSELSISVAVRDADADRAVRAVHAAFGLRRRLDVVVLGAGRVARALLAMMDDAAPEVDRMHHVELRLIALSGRGRAVVDGGGLGRDPLARLERDAVSCDLAALFDEVERVRASDVVVVDLTADELAPAHRDALGRGWSVVTANKKPLSGPLATWRDLQDAARAAGSVYGFETTFGAGLPVLHTLRDMVATADRLHAVRGCFSGTLGFLCTRLQEGVALADAVGEAASRGYTEPDPRDDLSGLDVARKAVIIARAMGRDIEPSEVRLEPFVAGLDDGLDAALSREGPRMAARVTQAAARGEVLRYVAEIDEEGVRVGLREVPANGAIGSLMGPDNILVFETARYRANPLVIRGPGAGADVTAAGVLGDVLKAASRWAGGSRRAVE
jgi:aspartokinase/homoserine dehydrogenase 1